jgi:hypothetical protein
MPAPLANSGLFSRSRTDRSHCRIANEFRILQCVAGRVPSQRRIENGMCLAATRYPLLLQWRLLE